ncbi:hypothetical protein N7448_001513 [Penicillium atrosanguineum]|uniref:Uncharacterized protein n=1 Tax=Penicillium atrosanguineum TaxID=1132637 RepID=A0A9W9HIK5_9EURO|nr:uncharacterized protein N7443_004911 [Penicillium atrosanguineum]KAJ5133459.1 hypothetical protein N7526_004824 [Penicillium atrosanguineum]KAJ5149935.1 hypothetical protein N7448_001513 [Penicillium atrosanguineum]KAJ5305251.1 hypothetical protein N7443_004911 [Penicillium atrosanguineum]KAJ5324715.1 hypothetical protein N7476_003315 [Penicillium atrosanguineum]
MSAPYPGRQSPPPERQSGAQGNDPPASGKIGNSSVRPGPEFGQQESDKSKAHGLESNPTHPLEKLEEAKYHKGTGN